ncbi:MAG: GspH/FimT family pseudopilin [Saccharospirillum sp.]|nr:GspH/FimT family pseudopilin [Saccharospirillum sp.]
MSSQKGVTLIELMITLAVIAIIASLAAPSFQGVIENNRVASQANGLLSAAHFARSEAVKTGGDVTLTVNADGSWCVHADADCTISLRTGGGVTANSMVPAGGSNITFDRRGESATGGNVTVLIHPAGCSGDTGRARQLTVTTVGRAAITAEDCPS